MESFSPSIIVFINQNVLQLLERIYIGEFFLSLLQLCQGTVLNKNLLRTLMMTEKRKHTHRGKKSGRLTCPQTHMVVNDPQPDNYPHMIVNDPHMVVNNPA